MPVVRGITRIDLSLRDYRRFIRITEGGAVIPPTQSIAAIIVILAADL